MSKAKKQSAERWIEAANEVPIERAGLRVPYAVLIGEAADVVSFVRKYWEPGDGRPGLKSAVKKKPGPKETFGPKIDDDIEELVEEVSDAHRDWLATSEGTTAEDAIARGEEAVLEVSRVLEWHFDDGVEDENDEQLARLEKSHADTGRGSDALAQELNDYLDMAEKHGDEIDGLLGFEAKRIGEMRGLVQELRGLPAPGANEDRNASKAALLKRNRLGVLLYERMQRVRAAARRVFSKHAAIAREATSAYERTKRAEARRKKGS